MDYNIVKELNDIKRRMYGTQFEQDMIIIADAISFIQNAPTVDAIPKGVLDQVRWERDIAMDQLKDHEIPFGGIAPDVVQVVRCKNCKKKREEHGYLWCHRWNNEVSENGFCSDGEREEE